MPAPISTLPDVRRVVALCGGVGGAKLALGLHRLLGPGRLTIVVNTGDDFTHLGLRICPDIDTVTYTLAGLADPERGWGRAGESWRFMAALRELGGPDWFQLGDQDLALHAARTAGLAEGRSLAEVTAAIASRLGIAAELLPMTDDPVSTVLHTDEGVLPFQDYFVARRCRPVVRAVRFDGAATARAQHRAIAAITAPDTDAIVVCPSNPFLSIDPILAVPGFRASLANCRAPIVAVSPIVGRAAVKGPTDKLMRELGLSVDQAAVAAHYRGLIDGLVLDTEDEAEAPITGVRTHVGHTVMRSLDDRIALARDVLAFAVRLSSAASRRREAA